ncbi:MAG: hypothetical protein LBG44_06530, partial [Gemmatimonadota bacterium]|nr:hypothetical protein [Gemmatimonadota bacterium]
ISAVNRSSGDCPDTDQNTTAAVCLPRSYPPDPDTARAPDATTFPPAEIPRHGLNYVTRIILTGYQTRNPS